MLGHSSCSLLPEQLLVALAKGLVIFSPHLWAWAQGFQTLLAKVSPYTVKNRQHRKGGSELNVHTERQLWGEGDVNTGRIYRS